MNINTLLVPIIAILVLVLVGALGFWFFLSQSAKNDKQAERKWTDPKFHD